MSQQALRGCCFGYAVRSQLPFHFLRAGGGDPLGISIHSEDGAEPPGRLVRRWNQDGNERFFARLFDDGRRYWLSIEGEGTFIVDPSAPHISVPLDGNRVKREERLWGIPALLCFLARGDLPLHAAAIEIDGEAVLLAAPGTFGKTTLAAGCARLGYRLLAEDLTCLRLLSPAEVVPGPAMLRVRRDVAEHLEVPFAERLEAGDDRLHFALDADRRGDGAPVPVRAVVFLHSRPDALELVRAEQGQAVRDLFALSFRLPGTDEASRAFTGVADLVANIRAWNLFYPRRLQDLDRTVEKIAEHA